MKQVSEMARQVYADILQRGFISPESAGTEFEVLGPLALKHHKNVRYFEELKKAGKVAVLEARSIHERDKFYAVPPEGWVAPMRLQEQAPVTQSNVVTDELRAVPLEHSAPTDWSKRGAIAAWIAIPITIIAILVAIYLDYN